MCVDVSFVFTYAHTPENTQPRTYLAGLETCTRTHMQQVHMTVCVRTPNNISTGDVHLDWRESVREERRGGSKESGAAVMKAGESFMFPAVETDGRTQVYVRRLPRQEEEEVGGWRRRRGERWWWWRWLRVSGVSQCGCDPRGVWRSVSALSAATCCSHCCCRCHRRSCTTITRIHNSLLRLLPWNTTRGGKSCSHRSSGVLLFSPITE